MALYKKELAAVPPLPFPNIKRGVAFGRPNACAVTIQRLELPRSGDVLFVDVYDWTDKGPSLRFVTDGERFLTAEEFPICGWTQRDPYMMIDIYHVDEVPGDAEAVANFLNNKYRYVSQILDLVHHFISNTRYERTQRKWKNERELREFHFRKYPELPKNLEDYCQTDVFDKYYLFFTKIQKHGKRDGFCSCCGKRFTVERGVKHNSVGVCPACGARVTLKADWFHSKIEDNAKICIADKSANNELLLRWVEVCRTYDSPGHKRKYSFFTYAYNLYLTNGKLYFYKWLTTGFSGGYYWYRGKIGDQCDDMSYIYTDNLDEVFGDRYYNVNLKAGLAGKRSQLAFSHLLNCLKHFPVAEYLFKMGLPRLASEAAHFPNVSAKPSFSSILGVRAEYASVFRDADVSHAEVFLIRKAESWVTADMIRRFRAMNIPRHQISTCYDMLASMSFEKMVNYFTKQASVCKRTAVFCMVQWRDYCYMCRTLNIDTSSKSVRFPKNIVEAHDELSVRCTAVKNAELDPVYRAAAECSYAKLGVQPFANNKYAIIPSWSATELVAEGTALGHCVGNGTYAKRVISGSILILFVRLAETPDKPFATLEYSIGSKSILQLYGKGNKAVSPECKRFVEGYLKNLTYGKKRKEKRA